MNSKNSMQKAQIKAGKAQRTSTKKTNDIENWASNEMRNTKETVMKPDCGVVSVTFSVLITFHDARPVARYLATEFESDIQINWSSCQMSLHKNTDFRFKCKKNWKQKWNVLPKTRGAYHLTKNSETFETGTNGIKISWEKFQKTGNCWISEKRTIQPKISEIPGWKSNGTGISRKNVSKIWVYLTSLSSFSEFMQIRNS